MQQGDLVRYQGETYRLLSDPTKTNALSLIRPDVRLITLDNQTVAPASEVSGITEPCTCPFECSGGCSVNCEACHNPNLLVDGLGSEDDDRDSNQCAECARSFGPWYSGECQHV